MSEPDYPDACPVCGSAKWLPEMGESMNLRHFRTCQYWHWYFDGGPFDGSVPKPFDHPYNSLAESQKPFHSLSRNEDTSAVRPDQTGDEK